MIFLALLYNRAIIRYLALVRDVPQHNLGGFMVKTFSMKLVPAMLLVAFSGAASASGFQLLEQNASGIGLGAG